MHLRTPVCTLAVLLILLPLLSCSKGPLPRVPVALMTKLEAGSIVGSSEVNAARIYMEQHPRSRLDLIPFNDNWDPQQARLTYADIRTRGIRLLVTSHTSTCAIAIASDINRDGILTMITGATTDVLSGQDDYILRNTMDVGAEQHAIAEFINGIPGVRLLVIRDTDNFAYTEPALRYLLKGLKNPPVLVVPTSIKALNPDSLSRTIREADYNTVYILVGGYRPAAGSLAQLAMKERPGCQILFTPWVSSPKMLEAAGPAIENSVIPSHYPPRFRSASIDRYFQLFHGRYGYDPTLISLNVFCALGILDEAVDAVGAAPLDVKSYILSKHRFTTPFDTTLEFDRFGDVKMPLYFLSHSKKEF